MTKNSLSISESELESLIEHFNKKYGIGKIVCYCVIMDVITHVRQKESYGVDGMTYFHLPKHHLDCVLCGRTIAYTDEKVTEIFKENLVCSKCCLQELKFDSVRLRV